MKSVSASVTRENLASVVALLRAQGAGFVSVGSGPARSSSADLDAPGCPPVASEDGPGLARLDVLCEDAALPAVLRIIGTVVHTHALGPQGVCVSDIDRAALASPAVSLSLSHVMGAERPPEFSA